MKKGNNDSEASKLIQVLRGPRRDGMCRVSNVSIIFWESGMKRHVDHVNVVVKYVLMIYIYIYTWST